MTEHKGEYDLYEKNKALMEAHQITAEDEYFAARPQIDCNDRRKVFEAGFQRAWNVALSATEQLELQEEVEELRQRLGDLKAAARRVVADTLAAEPKLYIIEEPRGCATPGACSALTQIDDLGMRIEALVWATVLRLNKAIADDDARL